MAKPIDLKYLGLVASKFDRFKKKKDDLWNCRCSFCGDSQKNKFKARGYFFVDPKDGDVKYKCFNCDVTLHLSGVLKRLDHSLYSQYRLERFKEKRNGSIIKKDAPFVHVSKPKFVPVPEFIKGLPKLNELPENHIARLYVSKRQIPGFFHGKLYYTNDFKRVVELASPEQAENLVKNEERLLIPFYDEYRNIFAFQGRALNDSAQRYITIRLDKDYDIKKPYGVNRLDLKKHPRVYFVEGPIDSMFLPNGLAAAGSSIICANNRTYAAKFDPKIVSVVYDNEKRNKEIVKKMLMANKLGYGVCVWPENIREKDINDMVLAGVKNISRVIDANTFYGLECLAKINFWKRCFV